MSSLFPPSANPGAAAQIPQLVPTTQPNTPPTQAANPQAQAKRPSQWALTNGPKSDAELGVSLLAVDVFHINIQVGDSTIYYLVEHPTDTVRQAHPEAKPFIHRAVLIDGGKEDGSIYLRNFLYNRVQNLYDFDDQQGGRVGLQFPPFDAVVITHWDQDHYAGLLALLQHHLCDNQLGKQGGATAMQNYLSPYMKYENDPNPLPTNPAPLTATANNSQTIRGNRGTTILYMPYWGRPVYEGSYQHKFSYELMSKTGCLFYNPDGIDNTKNPGSGWLDWNSDSNPQGKARVQAEWAEKLCKFRAGNANILGANLFTNLKPTETQCMEVDNPKELALAHHQNMVAQGVDPPHEIPVLCIVAANGRCCGEGADENGQRRQKFNATITELQNFYAPDLANKLNAAELLEREGNPERMSEAEDEILRYFFPNNFPIPQPDFPIVYASDPGIVAQIPINAQTSNPVSTGGDSQDSVMHGIMPQVQTPRFGLRGGMKIIDEHYTASNTSYHDNAISITCLLMWSDGRLSQYTAGDALWDEEIKVVAWVCGGKNPSQSVRSVKISHHGATASTPRELIQHFRPRNIVISNGDEFWHPRPELLLWLNLWFLRSLDVRYVPSLDPRRPKQACRGFLTATSYPYYLDWVVDQANSSGDFGEFIRAKTRIAEFAKKKAAAKSPTDVRGGPRNISLPVFENWDEPGAKTSGFAASQLDYQKSMYHMLSRLGTLRAPDPKTGDPGGWESTPGADDYFREMKAVRPASADPNDKLLLLRYVMEVACDAWTTLSDTVSTQSVYQKDLADHSLGHTVADGDMIQFIKIFSRPKDTGRRQMMDGVLDGTSLPASESTTSTSINDVGKPGKEYKIAFSMRFKNPEAAKEKRAAKAAKLAAIASTSSVRPPATSASSSIQNPLTPLSNLPSQQATWYAPPNVQVQFPQPFIAPQPPLPTGWVYKIRNPTNQYLAHEVFEDATSGAINILSTFQIPLDLVFILPFTPLDVTIINPYQYPIGGGGVFHIMKALEGKMGSQQPVLANANSSNAAASFDRHNPGPSRQPGTENSNLFNSDPNNPSGFSLIAAGNPIATSLVSAMQPQVVRRDIAPLPSTGWDDSASTYTDLVPAVIAPLWSQSGRSNPVKVIPEANFGAFIRCFTAPFFVFDQNNILSKQDDYGRMLLQFLDQDPDATGAQVLLDLSKEDANGFVNINIFSVVIPAFLLFPKLAFSSSPSAVGINFAGSGTLSSVPDTGIFPYHMFLALGLDKTNSDTANWRLIQILTFMGLLPDSIGTVLDALQTNLDEKDGETGNFQLSKGMIWNLPLENSKTIQRMEWNLIDAAQTKVKDFFNEYLDLTLDLQNFRIIGRKTGYFQRADDGYDLHRETEILFGFTLGFGKSDNPKVAMVDLEFDKKSGTGATFTMTLKFDGTGSGTHGATLTDIFGWIGALIKVPLEDVLDWFPKIDIASVKRVVLSCSSKSIDRIKVDLEVVPGWKDSADGGRDIILLFTYTWTKGHLYPHSLVGKVWFSTPEAAWLAPWIMPAYEVSRVIQPSQPAVSRIHLQSILPGLPSLPGELDLSISAFQVTVDGPNITFSGELDAMPTTTGNNHLGIELISVNLQASYMWGAKNDDGTRKPDGATYMISLYTDIELDPVDADADDNPQDGDDAGNADTAVLSAGVSLVSRGTDKLFQLYGGVTNLQMSQLGRFFPDEDRDLVTDILGHITLKQMTINYDYHSGTGAATQFHIFAAIVIDVVELDLTFFRDTGGWAFKAELTAADGVETNVGNILKALLGNDGDSIVDSMPPFLTNIELTKKSAGIRFTIESVKHQDVPTGQPPGPDSLVFSLTLWLPGPGGTDFEFTFIQIVEKTPQSSSTPTTDTSTTARSRTKRLVKVTINDLPWHLIPRPPVVDSIVPMFDSLGMFWVQDPTATKDTIGNTGLTLAEMKKINTSIPFPVPYKDPPASAPDTTVVLSSGIHFVILDSGGQGTPKMILDYAFNQPKPASGGGDSQPTDTDKGKPDAGLPDTSAQGTGTAKGSLQKTTNTFKVENVGIRYDNGELIIFLDIQAHMGPIGLALLGLGFGMKVADLQLSELGKHIPSFYLQGMGVEFNQPPVTIAGLFVEKQSNDFKMYIGGIAISIVPYQFIAVGAYGEVKKNTQDGDTFAQAVAKGNVFKTVFIFAKLNGPLIELEFATIGGITLGFGYNSTVVPPTVETVAQFPFIANGAAVSGTSDPLSIMTTLADPVNGVIRPQMDSFWLAAGLEAKAFEVLDVSAVVIIEFNPYVSLGIYARATASMPPDVPRLLCFTYVELGLLAYVDFHQGQFRVEAQLSPNSFVMNPLCHLSGGFALCTWFGSSPYAGDFVFSIGGYHPAYQPPSHYPVPPRLRISWGLDEHLCITGEAYFAITTKVCMGGGMLSAVFNMGLLSAYLTAHADFLMEFHPFFFVADLGLSIGVEFDLELLFITIHISVHINAGLHLQGPPFGGWVYVDFWVFGFTIPFGVTNDSKPAKTVEEFCILLANVPDPDQSAAPTDDKSPTIDKLHVLSVESGRFTEKQKDANTPLTAMWEVKRGGFIFRVQSRIPVTTIKEPYDATAITQDSTPFYCKPMHLTKQLISTMKVWVNKEEDSGDAEKIVFQISAPVKKTLPLSIWDKWDSNASPGSGNNNIENLLDSSGGTMPLTAGASFTAPPPIISQINPPAFNVIEASAEDVFADGEFEPELPGHITYAASSWTAADPATVPLPPLQAGATAPDPRENPWLAARNVWENPSGSGAPGEKDQAVVQATIDAWTLAFMWDYAPDGNILINEVTTKDGNEPAIWKNFEQSYMAAPMVGGLA